MKRFLPKTLTGQTVLVLLIGLSLSHLISMAIYSSDRAEVLTQMGGRDTAHHLANIARMVDQTPKELRTSIVSAIDQKGFNVWLTDESPLTHTLTPSANINSLRDYLHSQLNAPEKPILHVRVHNPAPHISEHNNWYWFTHWAQGMSGHRELQVSLRLGDLKTPEQWINFAVDIPQSNSLWSVTSVLSMFAMGGTVVLLSVWAVHRMTVPLRAFARAATRLGKDVDAPPLVESGPKEIREATVAFNEMQDRLKRMIDNRTQMLAAISHDLRTPITLLRLRSELVQDGEERTKMLATLDDMEKMIASTMDFARQDAKAEERRKVDLTALVASICDDMTDAGHRVTFEEPEKCLYECGTLSLRRAVTNLIDNALKFGGAAHVSMSQAQSMIHIVVEDEGPGIEESMLDDVFQPFFRCEDSRNPATGGTGLGLSVVQSVAHAHGGEIRLSNLQNGGLRAELELPV